MYGEPGQHAYAVQPTGTVYHAMPCAMRKAMQVDLRHDVRESYGCLAPLMYVHCTVLRIIIVLLVAPRARARVDIRVHDSAASSSSVIPLKQSEGLRPVKPIFIQLSQARSTNVAGFCCGNYRSLESIFLLQWPDFRFFSGWRQPLPTESVFSGVPAAGEI